MARRITEQGLAFALALFISLVVIGLPALLIWLDWITVDQVIMGILFGLTGLMVLITAWAFLAVGWSFWKTRKRSTSPSPASRFLGKMVIGMLIAGVPLLLWQLGRSGWFTKQGVLMALMILLSLLALMGLGLSSLPLIQFLRNRRTSASSPSTPRPKPSRKLPQLGLGWMKNLPQRAFALPSEMFGFLWRFTGRKSFLAVAALALLGIGCWHLGSAGWLRQCLIGLLLLLVVLQIWGVFRSADRPTRMARLRHLAVLLVPLTALAAWGFVSPTTSPDPLAGAAPTTPTAPSSSGSPTDFDTTQRLVLGVAVGLGAVAVFALVFLTFRYWRSRTGSTGGGRTPKLLLLALVLAGVAFGVWYFYPQLAPTLVSTPPPVTTSTSSSSSATTPTSAATPTATPDLQPLLKKGVLTVSSLQLKNFVGLSIPKYARVIILEDMPELEDLQGLTGYAVELRCLRCPKLASAAGFSSSVKTVLFEDCPLLPNLTGLASGATDVYVKNCRNFRSVGTLPGSVALLECSGCPLEDISGLGSSVKQLGCTDCYGNLDLATMPAGIRNVAFRNCRSVKSLAPLKSGIETLDISGSGVTDLTGAPDGIFKISLRNCRNLVNLMGAPASLLELDCSGSPNLTSLEGLREGIETIKIGSCPNLKLLGRLPRSLKRIVSHESYFSDLYQIPPGAVWEDR